MLACQPTATTTSAASRGRSPPSPSSTARTPASQRSNRWIDPAPSMTEIPVSSRALRDRAGDVRVLGQQDPRCHLDQRHLGSERVEDRSELNSGGAGADHHHRRRDRVQAPRVAVRRGQLEPGYRKRSGRASRADDQLVGLEPWPVLADERVRVIEAGRAGVLVDRHARVLQLPSQQRMRADVVGHFGDALEQPAIVELGLTGDDPVARELTRLAHQPRGVRERANWDRPIGGGHPAECVVRDQRGVGSESRRPQRGHDPRGPGPDHDDIQPRRGARGHRHMVGQIAWLASPGSGEAPSDLAAKLSACSR